MQSYCFLFLLICVSTARSASVSYGKHIPHGQAAVDFVYSERGTWKEDISEMKYVWNLHSEHRTDDHPYNPTYLRSNATGDERYTTRDINGHLYCDTNKDLELSQEEATNCGSGFYTHNGLSRGGAVQESSYTLFRLDDNQVGQHMSRAYGRPEPNGTVDHPEEFMRWKILGGNANGWRPYDSSFFDTLALDGIYYLATSAGSDVNAITKWNSILLKSLPVWDSQGKVWDYSQMRESYWLGLYRILTEWLLTRREFLSEDYYYRLVQHSVALRSQIIRHQEIDSDGILLGWCFDHTDGRSLMTTEGVAVNSLALGVNGKFTFEADSAPMVVGDGFFRDRFPHVVSAVEGESVEGLMSSGPNIPLEIGSYTVQFFLRTHVPVDNLAVVDVYDSTDSRVVNSTVVQAKSFYRRDDWGIVEVEVNIEEAGHSYEFRTHWSGQGNLDLAFVRVQ